MPPVTTFASRAAPVAPGVGPVFSMIMSWLSKEVPYFRYSAPGIPTLARTLYCVMIRAHQVMAVAWLKLMPRPIIATRRPPGSNRFSASSRWRIPYLLS